LVYFKYNCGFLESYLARKYRLVKTVVFRGSLVRLYARASDLTDGPAPLAGLSMLAGASVGKHAK
jgi:uncharacterized membrane protein YgdD (TMEM256/DUF423 family)